MVLMKQTETAVHKQMYGVSRKLGGNQTKSLRAGALYNHLDVCTWPGRLFQTSWADFVKHKAESVETHFPRPTAAAGLLAVQLFF